jgi:hypothetical protein
MIHLKLKGKKCLITGASSGIGLSLTKQLLKEGVRVFAVSLEEMPLHDLYLSSYTCDLSIEDNVTKSFNQAIKEMGAIDIYIANAGQARYGLSKDLNQTSLNLMMNLNFYAPIQGLKLMINHHQEKPFTFMATSSVMAFWPLPGYAAYAGTKAALSTYIKAYRHEVDKGQTLILSYPVATNTNFFQISGQKHQSWMIQEPDKVANKMIQGIKKGRKVVYPSFLFRLIHTFCPFLLKPYMIREKKILRKDG